MAERGERLLRRWLADLRAASVSSRIGDLLDGFRFDVVLDGDAVRIEGRADGLHVVPGEGGRGRTAQVRTSLATLVRIARGDVSLRDATRDGDLEYFAEDADPRSLTRFVDRAEAAWRIFLSSDAALRLRASVLDSAPGLDDGGEPPDDPADHPATVAVPTVTVFGAGITGLTVAHELVERGFRVQVLERAPAGRGHDMCEVGGMARTQVVRLPTLSDVAGAPRDRGVEVAEEPYGDGVSSMVSTEPPYQLREHIDFVPGDSRLRPHGLVDSWGRCNGDRLDAMVGELRKLVEVHDAELNTRLEAARARGALHPEYLANARPRRIKILVGGHFRGMRPSPTLALRRARIVARALSDALGDLAARFELTPDVVEDREPWTDGGAQLSGEAQRADRVDRVDLRAVDERIAPGEHGYRFFPAFYRNLFHTMKRIPLFDDKGRETGHTTFDNLIPTAALLLVPFEGQGTVEVPRKRIQTIEGIRRVLHGLYERLDFEYRDVVLFEIRLFKFMSSCWERRRQTSRELSWREYIGVGDFTPHFQQFLLDAPQALVAMNAEEIDARTHGNISVQLLLDQVGSGRESDMTLNGPTTNAFLKPWKDYLKHHGVRFFLGELAGLQPDPADPARMTPVVRRSSKVVVPNGATPGDEPVGEGNARWMPRTDYYVMALPVENTWEILGNTPAPQLEGDFAQLRRWYDQIQHEVKSQLGEGYLWKPGHDVPRRPDKYPVGPLRDFAGIQFYFNYALQIGASGHIYYVNTPWGLSSFNQPPFWRVRRVLERHRYLAGISIDIGRWYNAPGTGAAHPDVVSAIRTPPLPLAQETWRQIIAGFGPEYSNLLRAPNWYHLDDSLRFDKETGTYVNDAPFLINRPEDWDQRPGTSLKELLADIGHTVPPGWDAQELSYARAMATHLPSGIWYRMGWGQWMLAGTFMKTHTRMTTMEAANESARHAVNRILHHLAHRRRADPHAPPSAGVLMGDYCPTWDPEENELDDVEPLKRLDRKLFERGLPHLVDILRIERFAKNAADSDALDRLRGLLDAARGFAGGGHSAEGSGGWLTEMERELRKWME